MLIYAKYLILVNHTLDPMTFILLCPPNIFFCRISLVEYSRTQGLLTPVADEGSEPVCVASYCMTVVSVDDDEE